MDKNEYDAYNELVLASLDSLGSGRSGEASLDYTEDDDENYTSDVEDKDVPEELSQTHLSFHFSVKKQYAKAIDARREAITGDEVPEDEVGEMLHKLYKAAKGYTAEDLPTGKGKGRVVHLHGSDDIKVRLDRPGKEKKGDAPKLFPRVFRDEEDDLTTEAIAELVDTHAESIESFLAGVRGTKQPSSKGKGRKAAEAAEAAFEDGRLARAIFLVSDLLDYPGNSAIVEELLSGVRDAESYRTLLNGDKDGSYGALPSQNRHNGLETDKDRIKPYKAAGELFETGRFSTSAAPSNRSTLRKLSSITAGDKKIFKVRYSHAKAKTASDVPDSERRRLSTKRFRKEGARYKLLASSAAADKLNDKGIEALSDPEDSVEEEASRIASLTTDELLHRQEALRRIERKRKIKAEAIALALEQRRKASLSSPKKSAKPSTGSGKKVRLKKAEKKAEKKVDKKVEKKQSPLALSEDSDEKEPSGSSSSSSDDDEKKPLPKLASGQGRKGKQVEKKRGRPAAFIEEPDAPNKRADTRKKPSAKGGKGRK